MKNNPRRRTGSPSNLSALFLVPGELAGCIRRKGYLRLTPRAVIELAAPQTWSASVMPPLLAAALTIVWTGTLQILLFFSLLATSVCLQCAVNTLNDYSDFMAGVDRRETCEDPTDASIIYHEYEPVLAFVIGMGFILLGLLCGLYAILRAGPELLIFGAVGAAIVFLYTYGLLPLSYTPIGEALSGIAMGGVITIACVYALTRGALSAAPAMLFAGRASIPLIITIGLIMLTNNTCDIEKDLESNRLTLPARTGRPAAKKLHILLFSGAVVYASIFILINFPNGLWLEPLLCAWLIPQEIRIIKNGLTSGTRIRSMSLATGINIRLNAVYIAMILLPQVTI